MVPARTFGALAALAAALLPTNAAAHCEIPCGIYDDQARVEAMKEHATTIAKAVDRIAAAANQKSLDALGHNQLARWVANKEEHATALQTIVSQYFMTQRIKPAGGDDEQARGRYLSQLTAAHELLLAAMKTKQTVDPTAVAALRQAIERFAGAYFAPIDEKHGHKH